MASSKQKYTVNTIADFSKFVKDEKVLMRFNLSRLAVFGSLARNEKARDIDLLVEDAISLESAYLLKTYLENILNKPVDVVLANRVNPIILYRANREKVYVA